MLYSSFALFLLCSSAYSQELSAHGLRVPLNRDGPRRMPVSRALMQAMGPLAFGKKTGDDLKWDVPNFGKVGFGNGHMQMVKFVPSGAEHEVPNGGTWTIGDKPNLGYMEHDSTIGRSAGSSAIMNLNGIGSFISENNVEKGTGLLDFSKALFPFLQLPPPKNEEQERSKALTPEEERLSAIYYPKPRSYLDDSDPLAYLPPSPFDEISPEKRIRKANDDASYKNPFDQIKNRPGYARFKALASKTTQAEDADLLEKPDSPFKEESGVVLKPDTKSNEAVKDANFDATKKAAALGVGIPISQLGLDEKQIFALCARFAPVAAKYCYVRKIEPMYIDRCRGYINDCAKFMAQAKPLGAIANAWSSGVGLSFYDWQVKGIPYYPINEEGTIGNGVNGKVDFGTWGGGYSQETGVRDFFSGTQEYGANWYEGTYGWKQGFSAPIVQSLGIESARGTMVHVPVKEGELGRPVQVTNSYSFGPYVGLADKYGIDWYNGGVSVSRGVDIPFVGVGVSTGIGVGFPSIGTFAGKMGLNGVQRNAELAQTRSGFDSSIGLSGDSSSALTATSNGNPLLQNLISLAQFASARQ